METTISAPDAVLAVCYTLQFLSLFNLLNGLWQRKLSKLTPVYDSGDIGLPAKGRVQTLYYKLLMQKLKTSLVPTFTGFSSHTYAELFQKELVLIEKRNKMVDKIIKLVRRSTSNGKRNLAIFGGFVRDFVLNQETTKFMNFKDFDVKCKSSKTANLLVAALSEKFDVAIVNQSSCTCRASRNVFINKTVSKSCSCRYCVRLTTTETEIKEEEFTFDLCVITINVTHRKHPEISFPMDIVVDPSSFVKTKQNKKFKITSKNPDFDVNQLFLENDSDIKSMVKSLDIETVKKNIQEKVFTVFSPDGELHVNHVVNSLPYAPYYPIETDLLDYPVSMNSHCIYRSAPKTQSINQYTDLDFNTRGKKIEDRINKMKKKGWTCLTCPNGCSNPLCIFSPDAEYQKWIEARNKYNSDIDAYQKAALEKRLAEELHAYQNYINNRPIGSAFHFKYAGKNRQVSVFEKKCKSNEIERTKKHMRKFNIRANEKRHAQFKHSDLVEDRFVKKK